MSKIRRQRGAQPGNHNALKHGFYSKFHVVTDKDKVPARAALAEMDHDIALTRATLKALFAKSPDNLKLISYTISLRNRLLRTRQLLRDRDRRAKLRRSRTATGSNRTANSPACSVTACLPTSALSRRRTEEGLQLSQPAKRLPLRMGRFSFDSPL